MMLLQVWMVGEAFGESFLFPVHLPVQIAEAEYQRYRIGCCNGGFVSQKVCGYMQHCGDLEQGAVTDAHICSVRAGCGRLFYCPHLQALRG